MSQTEAPWYIPGIDRDIKQKEVPQGEQRHNEVREEIQSRNTGLLKSEYSRIREATDWSSITETLPDWNMIKRDKHGF